MPSKRFAKSRATEADVELDVRVRPMVGNWKPAPFAAKPPQYNETLSHNGGLNSTVWRPAQHPISFQLNRPVELIKRSRPSCRDPSLHCVWQQVDNSSQSCNESAKTSNYSCSRKNKKKPKETIVSTYSEDSDDDEEATPPGYSPCTESPVSTLSSLKRPPPNACVEKCTCCSMTDSSSCCSSEVSERKPKKKNQKKKTTTQKKNIQKKEKRDAAVQSDDGKMDGETSTTEASCDLSLLDNTEPLRIKRKIGEILRKAKNQRKTPAVEIVKEAPAKKEPKTAEKTVEKSKETIAANRPSSTRLSKEREALQAQKVAAAVMEPLPKSLSSISQLTIQTPPVLEHVEYRPSELKCWMVLMVFLGIIAIYRSRLSEIECS